MAYTTNQLINDAYFLANIVGREFETIDGPQIESGLRWLNDVLEQKVVEKTMIPYETKLTFDTVIGQEEYFFENLIDVDTLTFNLDTVRYSMYRVPRDIYFGNLRTNNIQSLPSSYHLERKFGGASIFMYFLPDRIYPFEIFGITRLANIVLGQDLDLTVDKFYLTYLRYSLADFISAEYNQPTPITTLQKLKYYESLISKQSRPLDLSIKKQSTLNTNRGFGWDFVNLGRGWLPPAG